MRGAQHKAWNYALDKLALCGFCESEVSHPMWNAFKKAVSHSKLSIPMMKLTICCALFVRVGGFA